MSSFRLFFRLQPINGARRKEKIRNVLIVGAGDTGESLVREILNNPNLEYEVVGFIDDDPRKRGMSIHGLKIHGRCYDIPQIVQLKSVDEIMVAISKASSGEMDRIVSFCEKGGEKYRIVPSVSDLISGKVYISKIRNVEVSDLLGREALKLDLSAMRRLIAGKAILITGGAGSIGSDLCRRILSFGPGCLVIVDKGENALWSLKWEINRSFPGADVHFYLSDVGERRQLREIFQRHQPKIVFHCAGVNHIPVLKGHEEKVFQENVYATKVVADLTKIYKGEKFVLLSSHNVTYPTSVVGVTKKLAELYVQRMAKKSRVGFVIIRFGTVLNSQGTFLEFFKKQLHEGGPITVSHPEARGYFMTVTEAVELILQATAMGRGGQTLVLNMGEKVRIADIAEKLVKLSGLKLGRDIVIDYVGLPSGEKLSEELWEDGDKLLPTRHDKIKRICFPQNDYPSLDRDIAEMRKMATKADREAVMRKLCEIVPTYQFPGKKELLTSKPSHHISASELTASSPS
jgi:FlaA1/EpsC-like NDP-sugar epimerase